MIEKIKAAINKRMNIIATDGLNPFSDIEEIASAKYRIDGLKNALSIIEAIEQEKEVIERPSREMSILLKIARILSKYKDKEGSPLEQIRLIVLKGAVEGLIEQEKAPMIKGWVARDADEDLLCWFSDKPVPSKEMPGCWLVPHPLTNWVKLPKEAYPDLRPERGPIKVDLILQRNEH